MTNGVCRWGILGTATIARKNWKAIWNAENCTLTSVASRDLDRSRRYISECQAHVPFEPAPRAFGSYEELLASDQVDAVYIPLPTVVRKEWVLRAADAGKHVMCEKPCGARAADVEEMIEACQRNNVQFMDGVMFMHSRRMRRIREVLDDGCSLGDIKRITSQFSFAAPEDWVQSNIRTSSELEPLGCLGDLGWYNIRFSLWTMNWQMPQCVTGRMLQQRGRDDSPAPVPMEMSGELIFSHGVSAGFYCSFLTENQQWANVSGTKGFVLVPDFVLPYYGSEVGFEVNQAAFEIAGCDFNMENHTRREAVFEYSSGTSNSQEANLFRNFAQLALSGQPDVHWGNIALQTQQVLDACLQSARSGSREVELG